jgi:glutathione S-transferase
VCIFRLVHHLGASQSERIVWLCEELAIRIRCDATIAIRLRDLRHAGGPQRARVRAHEFTAADIMMLFPLSTMQAFVQRDLSPLLHIRAYLKRIGERPAYQRAMAKGDPGMSPVLA